MKKTVGIYRITHYRNLPFILQNGLHCHNCEPKDEQFIQIGFRTLINLRTDWPVSVPPGGVLGNYVPFYFTVKSPMLYVIAKGNDPEVVGNQDEIIYLVSTVEKIQELGIPYVFTDRNAKLGYASFSNNYKELEKLDWKIIHGGQWGRQYGLERIEIKQAECLMHQHVPIEAIIGIACKTQEVMDAINIMLSENNCKIPLKIKTNWYY